MREWEPQISWKSPLREENYNEYRDAEFLQRVGLAQLKEALKEFWPAGGPRWDGLAVYETASGRSEGVILVEGRSDPDEFYSDGCDAGRSLSGKPSRGSAANRIQIAIALRRRRPGLA